MEFGSYFFGEQQHGEQITDLRLITIIYLWKYSILYCLSYTLFSE